MRTTKTVLVVGAGVDTSSTGPLQAAAAHIGVAIERAETRASLEKSLDAAVPLAVVVPMADSGALDACMRMRAQSRLAHVPLLGVAARRDSLAFLELYQWGGDDLVDEKDYVPALVRRFERLAKLPAAPPRDANEERIAVIAGPDARWRGVVARALFNAGLNVSYASKASDVVAMARSCTFVVAAHDLGPAGAAAALAEVRASGATMPWVIAVPPEELASIRDRLAGFDRIAFVDVFSPPENALFAANQLAQTGIADQRGEPRLLHGATVTFRVAGSAVDEVGFSYNVSASGVYVRTMAPLEARQEVWVEIATPRHDRRVRLAGMVAWRREFSRSAGAVVPPGFAVHLEDGLYRDLDDWREACDALATETLGAPPKVRSQSTRVASRVPSAIAPAIVSRKVIP